MKKEDIKVVSFEDGESPILALSSVIQSAFEVFSGKNMYIINRKAERGYYFVFAEALFDYEAGVLLLERFYKKEKCAPSGTKIKTFSEDDRQLMIDFHKFSEEIPDVASIDEDEKLQISVRLKEFQDKVKQIKPDITVLDTYRYKDYLLVSFDDTEDTTKEVMANMYADFGITMLSTLAWAALKDVSFMVSTIEFDDYVDLILIPIKNSEV